MKFPYINRDELSSCDISFFVPCLNESGNIGPTLNNIKAACAQLSIDFEVLVFDDASTDSSREDVRDFAKQNPHAKIKLVANQSRRGLARNYIDGAYLARGRHYMLVNGDNAEPVETIRAIIGEMGKADIIIPIFAGNDHRTVFRRNLSRTFTSVVNFVSGNKIGYYNGPALHRRFNVMRWHADTDGFAYQAEIITQLLQEGASYHEVIVKNSDRVLGASSALNLKNLLAVSHSLVQIGLRRLRYGLFYSKRRPATMALIEEFPRGLELDTH